MLHSERKRSSIVQGSTSEMSVIVPYPAGPLQRANGARVNFESAVLQYAELHQFYLAASCAAVLSLCCAGLFAWRISLCLMEISHFSLDLSPAQTEPDITIVAKSRSRFFFFSQSHAGATTLSFPLTLVSVSSHLSPLAATVYAL